MWKQGSRQTQKETCVLHCKPIRSQKVMMLCTKETTPCLPRFNCSDEGFYINVTQLLRLLSLKSSQIKWLLFYDPLVNKGVGG